MDVRSRQADHVLVPTNLKPLSTVHLQLALATKVAGAINGGYAERAQTAGDALAVEPEVAVQLTSLGRKVFIERYQADSQGLNRSGNQRAVRAA